MTDDSLLCPNPGCEEIDTSGKKVCPNCQEPIPARVEITMVGPSGVGKTSLLASMYHRMKEVFNDLDCTFTASAACSGELNDRRDELKSLATDKGLKVDLDLGGVKPGADKRIFDFQLRTDDTHRGIWLRFVDLPGGWYTGKGNYQEADRSLAKSDVVIVAVDAWALMEANGRYHDKINRPGTICDALERAFTRERNKEVQIFFVLVKGEKYLHGDRREELLKTAAERYLPLLGSLQRKRPPIPIIGCAVETVGGIELNSVTERDGRPWGEFRRIQRGSSVGYCPTHCEIPLQLLFKRTIETRVEKPREPTFFDQIIEILASPFGGTDLQKEIKTHAEWKRVAEKLSAQLEKAPLYPFSTV